LWLHVDLDIAGERTNGGEDVPGHFADRTVRQEWDADAAPILMLN
jgi:hypothetical protein